MNPAGAPAGGGGGRGGRGRRRSGSRSRLARAPCWTDFSLRSKPAGAIARKIRSGTSRCNAGGRSPRTTRAADDAGGGLTKGNKPAPSPAGRASARIGSRRPAEAKGEGGRLWLVSPYGIHHCRTTGNRLAPTGVPGGRPADQWTHAGTHLPRCAVGVSVALALTALTGTVRAAVESNPRPIRTRPCAPVLGRRSAMPVQQ
jgi:hypothetical protein